MKKNVARFIEFSYEKLTLLKQSERGEVWLAKDIASGDLVIMKYVKLTGLPYSLIQNSTFRLPAKIFFIAESETDTIVVEEYIRGESMNDWVEQKRFFNEDFAREILIQLCDGLKELHEKNIIHRDIKPSNLILQGGQIRLIDFDAARIFKTGQEKDTKRLGTQGYAAPEQYGGSQTDPRSDIYSLGVTMKILLGDNYDGRLKNILDKCTEYDPARRFKNVSDLKRAVRFEKFSYWSKIFASIFFAGKILLTFNHSVDVAPPHNEEISNSAESPEPVETVESSKPAEPTESAETYEPAESSKPAEPTESAEIHEPVESPEPVESVESPEPVESPPTLNEFKPSFPGKAPSSIEEFTPSFPSEPTFKIPESNPDA